MWLLNIPIYGELEKLISYFFSLTIPLSTAKNLVLEVAKKKKKWLDPGSVTLFLLMQLYIVGISGRKPTVLIYKRHAPFCNPMDMYEMSGCDWNIVDCVIYILMTLTSFSSLGTVIFLWEQFCIQFTIIF